MRTGVRAEPEPETFAGSPSAWLEDWYRWSGPSPSADSNTTNSAHRRGEVDDAGLRRNRSVAQSAAAPNAAR